MARSSLLISLLIIFLGFNSLLICSNAVPTSRSAKLMNGYQLHQVSTNTQMVINSADRNGRRMVVELNDYPGSGANNRHTPRPQFARSGCADC